MSETEKSLSEIARDQFGDAYKGEVEPGHRIERRPEATETRTKPWSQIAREMYGLDFKGEQETERTEIAERETEDRKEIEAETVSDDTEIPAPAWSQDEMQFLTVVQQEIGRFQTDLMALAKATNEPDLNEIAKTDKGRAAAIRRDLETAKENLRQRYEDLVTAAKDIQARAQQKNQAYVEQHLTREHKRLKKAMPDVDPAAAREYLEGLGFTKQDIESTYDHRVVILADKARRYDALMAEKKPRKVIPMKKGAKPKKVENKDGSVEKLRERLKETGSIHDAMALFKARKAQAR